MTGFWDQLRSIARRQEDALPPPPDPLDERVVAEAWDQALDRGLITQEGYDAVQKVRRERQANDS